MRSSHENIYRSFFPRYGSKVVTWKGRHASLIQQDERRPQGTEIEQKLPRINLLYQRFSSPLPSRIDGGLHHKVRPFPRLPVSRETPA
jgi:hypothetical protein